MWLRTLGIRSLFSSIAVTFAMAFAATPIVAAQANLESFEPPAGRIITPTIPDPDGPDHGGVTVGSWLSYARQVGDPEVYDRPLRVSELGSLQLGASLGLWERLDLGLVMPLGLVRVSDSMPRDDATRTGAGDLRGQLALALLSVDAFSAAWLNVLSLPIGDVSVPLGDRAATWTSSLVAAQRLGPVRLAARAGYHLRPDRNLYGVELADELRFALGARYRFARALDAFVELDLRIGAGGQTLARGEHSGSTLLGARLRPWSWLEADLGVGTAAFPWSHGYGSADIRVVLGLRAHIGRTRPTRAGPAGACDGPKAGGSACGAADVDGDGVPDDVDRCPGLAEDRDGYQDADGCPEPDNDLDGVPDADDRCPLDPEDRDGYEDADGCPEPGPAPVTVTVTQNRILVSDSIYFETGEDVIRAVSRKVLDEVARAIAALSDAKHVLVIGHTDQSGDPQRNRDLSYRRARAVVEYLRGRGVAEARLRFEGRGGDEPVAEGGSPEARAMNRRVEFRILGAADD